MENELKINEVEISKLSVGPNELLFVRVLSDDLNASAMTIFRDQLRAKMTEVLGPDAARRVIVVYGTDIKFTSVEIRQANERQDI